METVSINERVKLENQHIKENNERLESMLRDSSTDIEQFIRLQKNSTE
jgi:hypothetical protein